MTTSFAAAKARFVLLALAILLCLTGQSLAQTTCPECPLPAHYQDSVVDVHFRDGTRLQNSVSLKRVVISEFDKRAQGLHICYYAEGGLRDTVVPIAQAAYFEIAGLGMHSQPIRIPVAPAREFYRDVVQGQSGGWLAELSLFAGYAGSDTSSREIGAPSPYLGVSAVINPLGELLGPNASLLLEAELLSERSRLRFPLGLQFRWTLEDENKIETREEYLPGYCQFGGPEDPALPSPEGYIEVPSSSTTDHTVHFQRSTELVPVSNPIFAFAEGGVILNSSFEGGGPEPSVNPDDYGQYYLGAGAGMPVFDDIVLQLAYRYMRLNLRTPCPVCPETLFFQNTNTNHSVLLRAGYRF